MRAVAYVGNGAVEVIDVPAPAETVAALVRVERAGLCGTDLKIVRGDIAVAAPRVLGHEIVGRVEHAAAGVDAGARVLVDPFSYSDNSDLPRNVCERQSSCVWNATDQAEAYWDATDF